MKLLFSQANKSNWGDLQLEIANAISTFLKSKKDFEVEFREVKDGKSWEQLKGIHRLAQALAIRLSEANGIKYSMENAKDWIKWNCDFVEQVSEQQAISEAINERNKAKQSNVKMTKEEFVNLVNVFKTNLKKPRSFATASKEEMIIIIERVHAIANKMEWKECILTSDEIASLVKFYDN